MSDLFAHADRRAAVAEDAPAQSMPQQAAAALGDEALIAAIPSAGLREAPGLASEAGRRHLTAAIPALEALCRRLTGFGADQPVREQIAALEALAAIGGAAATRSLVGLIAAQTLQGPNLRLALTLAVRLGATLPLATARLLGGHPDPAIRAALCLAMPPLHDGIVLLRDRLDDRDPQVRRAAALALGRRGRAEARPLLRQLLISAPDAGVIEAVAAIADRDCIVLIGRSGRTVPALRAAALAALEGIDEAPAAALAAELRQLDG